MNESLINPFSISHPTAVQTSLYAIGSFAKFDPSGRYIGTGRYDGTAAIWDLETRSEVRLLDGHVSKVHSFDWSRNSRFAVTASKDWNVVVWDLSNNCDPLQRHATMRFDAPVLSATFHPRNSNIILVLLSTGEAYVVDQREQHRSRMELVEAFEARDDEDEEEPQRAALTAAQFDPTGKHIFVGTSSGTILVFNSRTKTMVGRHTISGSGPLKGFAFAKSGRRIVTNSDRTLRQFNLPQAYPEPSPEGAFVEGELDPTHRFSDPISKTAWHAMSYSPDGEWLAGGAADPAGHKIYVWDISNNGQFATTLDGGSEPLVHLDWHPYKSCIASTTNTGIILIWHSPTPERWGAFAGGFEEVDENVEYEEREDEFDIEDEAEIEKRKAKEEEEDVDIDIVEDPSVEANGHALHHRPPRPVTPSMSGVADDDEDMRWADDEPDEDVAPFKMAIRIVDEDQ